MENTQEPTVPTEPQPPHGIAQRLLADRHSLPLSIALHLVPGALIVAVYLLIAEPLVLAIGYPVFLGWAIALSLVLGPLMAGLYWLGRKRNGRFSLRGVLHYTDKPLPRGKLVALVIPMFLWMMVVSTALVPLDGFVFDHFFTWLPFAEVGGSATTYLEGNGRSVMLTTLAICLPLTGISLPLIEEFYFRGFLLPRIAQLGPAAPVLSTVLFSLYHFWAPWTFVSKLIFFFPGPWFVWKKKDIRLSIGMHVGSTSISMVGGIVALALNLV
ncbi:Abortive infection protein [Kribbella flavida DSM 17836]|uniref:Abortive infection protein n=1 Tax=Kribbella flavida (strain DSM 17836 / JCM 10339 / NBRC 14399) TaxID=479435 RepID=D2PLJ9_KRIFD|nr:CPBP family intramembrane glutamic endopeptidase [Kribbella flavida]ADB30628.1 Abortive infection protein [Kribbella flavida DSM 17836]